MFKNWKKWKLWQRLGIVLLILTILAYVTLLLLYQLKWKYSKVEWLSKVFFVPYMVSPPEVYEDPWDRLESDGTSDDLGTVTH